MKFVLLPLSALAFLLFGCDKSAEECPPYRLEQLNVLEQQKIEAEVLAMMEDETIEAMLMIHRINQGGCYTGLSEAGLKIQKDENGAFTIRGKRVSLKNVSTTVYMYYTINEKLSEQEVEEKIGDTNYAHYNYPFFGTVTQNNVKDQVRRVKEYIEAAKKGGNEDLVIFHDKELNEWKKYLDIFQVIGRKQLNRIDQYAHVLVLSEMEGQGLSEAAKQAIVGMLKVRNRKAQELFDASYLDLYYRAEYLNDTTARKQMKAVDFMNEIKIIDQQFMNANRWEMGMYNFETGIELLTHETF